MKSNSALGIIQTCPVDPSGGISFLRIVSQTFIYKRPPKPNSRYKYIHNFFFDLLNHDKLHMIKGDTDMCLVLQINYLLPYTLITGRKNSHCHKAI